MAVPFYVPEEEDQRGAASNNSSPPQSANSSTTTTPLQSPVSGEHLVQAFCEALYRITGSPGFPLPPPSPSCSPNNTTGYYGDVFFPHASTPRTTTVPRHYSDEYAGPRAHRTNRNSRIRLNSTGDYDDECSSEFESSFEEFDEHFNFMAARERLQEFQGRVPQRKKKKEVTVKPIKTKSKDQTFAWPTVVTAVVIAVGCGFLVTR